MTTELVNVITTQFTNIKEYILQGLAVVVPLALIIFGVWIIWHWARRFFVSMVFGRGSQKEQEREFLEQDNEDFYDDDED